MAASVTTDAAYGIVRRSCEDLTSSLPGRQGYMDMCDMFVEEKVLEGDEMTCSMAFELADYLAMPVEDLLMQFANVLSKKPKPVYNGQLGYYRGDDIPVEASAPEQLD